jgi:large subunit ribosomal protein L23
MAELHPYDVIRRAVVTEKTNGLAEALNQFAFEVAGSANKAQIKDAVELIFDKKGEVVKVRTLINPAKRGRRGRKYFLRSRQWKKAIVTLKEGSKIELFNV